MVYSSFTVSFFFLSLTMECENFDRFISHTSMDPLLFNNNADWEIDWSLVDSLAFPDSFDCLQFPETEKIAVQDAGIPWTEPDPLGLFDLTYDETDSQLGITEHDVASIFDNIKGTETPTPDIQKEIQELRQAITDMQQHMKKLDDMYFDIKEE